MPKSKIRDRVNPQVQQKQDVQGQLQVKQTRIYQAPIPPPEAMAKYEELQPGFADRILAMAEKEGDHRREAESKIIRLSYWNDFIGKAFAFASVLSICGLCLYAYSIGYATQATTLGTTVMIGLAGVFIYKRGDNDKK